MNLAEAGAALRAEREKRNLTVEDIAQQLKISPRQIRALESGDLDSLPHEAYARGFIRSYAAWLGITPEELGGGLTGVNSDSASITKEKDPGQSSGGNGLIWALALLLVLLACGYYAWTQNFWGFLERENPDGQSISEKLPTAEEYLAKKEETANTAPEPIQKAAPVPAPVELPVTIAKPSPPALLEQKEVKENESVSENVAPVVEEEIAVAGNPATHQGNHKLIISAIEECWVHSNSDKTDTRQFSLRKGDTFALTFAESLELKLGNAGGVRLRYDGQDLPAPGTSGQVKTIVFPPVEE